MIGDDPVRVDEQGYVYVVGVKVARRVERDGVVYLRFHDRDRRRSAQRSGPLDVALDVLLRSLE